jgi:hypothetical protein
MSPHLMVKRGCSKFPRNNFTIIYEKAASGGDVNDKFP